MIEEEKGIPRERERERERERAREREILFGQSSDLCKLATKMFLHPIH